MPVDFFNCWLCQLDSCQAPRANAVLAIAYDCLFVFHVCFLFPSPHVQSVAVFSICQIKIFPRTRSLVVRPGNVGPIEFARPVMIFVSMLLVAYKFDHNERYSLKRIAGKEARIMTHQTPDSDLRRSDLGH
jgi:hypothetical protein